MSAFGILLVPAEKHYKKYNTIIKTLAKKYNTPVFDAHVTIVGKTEAEEKDLIATVRGIAKGFKKIEVEILGMNFTNTYYQCVFAQIKMTPQLLSLRQEFETKLQYPSKPAFFPHMSLIYGDFSPEEKVTIATQVKPGKKLLLDKLIIVRDGPLPSDWTHAAEFELE